MSGRKRKDGNAGGLVALAIAAPVMVLCCAGGGVFLTAAIGGLAGWLGGLGGASAVLVLLAAALLLRGLWRQRAGQAGSDAACCDRDARGASTALPEPAER